MDGNLDLFERMHAGEFPDAARVLRTKIDIASLQSRCHRTTIPAVFGPLNERAKPRRP
jgi:hypothetical protein